MSASRLCLIAPEFIGPFPNGGVGTACYWEAVQLGSAGFDVTVLYTGPTERGTSEHWTDHFARTAPFRYVDLAHALSSADRDRLERHDHLCAEARTADLVLAWLRREPCDAVLVQEFLGHGARALQARAAGDALGGVRIVTTLHSSRQWIFEGMERLPSGIGDLAVDFLEKESARLADAVIAPSHHMADWATTHWRLPRRPAVVPYCFDETAAGPPGRIEHAGPFRHLVFFGRLETRKGLHLFCRALADHRDLSAAIDRVTFLGKPSSVEGQPSEAFIADHLARIPGLDWSIVSHLGSLEAQDWLARQPGTLVVTPSLVDNLPYAVIELWTRRIPFVAARTGGIPEIVGAANDHLLAQPTEASLAATLSRVVRSGSLAVDYGSGYDVRAANAAHVALLRELVQAPARPSPGRPTAAFDVVVLGAPDSTSAARARARLTTADPTLTEGRWFGPGDWHARSGRPAIVLDARVTPAHGFAARLLAALRQPHVDAATAYYHRDDGSEEPTVVAPLGGSLETGWRQNQFGGPAFAVGPMGAEALAAAMATANPSPPIWSLYAAIVTGGCRLAMIPAPLYTAPTGTMPEPAHAEVESVIAHYHRQAPRDLDLGWVLKAARAGSGSPGSGRNAWEQLVSMADDTLETCLQLDPGVSRDPFVRALGQVRDRVGARLSEWRVTDPRVFVYGTGLHTKLLLSICPELSRFVAGFIDRRPVSRFLGRPCVRPEAFDHRMADAVVYSSREFEQDMYARLRNLPIEHVLLYQPSPAAPEASTAQRLRRRFGCAGTDPSALDAVYRPPAWATGFISRDDAAFLAGIVEALGPRVVVELGVASGVSSAILLHALDRLPADGEPRVLHSCDVSPRCYFDAAYPTGQACGELYPLPRASWQPRFDTDARRLLASLPSGSVDLTFIDANHCHPWPLLDLLHLAAIARPGSWVVLHDVDLPVQHPEYQIFGARWLYQAWPFNKVKGVGPSTSIGAVQLPEHLADLLPMASALLDEPWEDVPAAVHVGLPPAFAALQTQVEARLAPQRAGVA